MAMEEITFSGPSMGYADILESGEETHYSINQQLIGKKVSSLDELRCMFPFKDIEPMDAVSTEVPIMREEGTGFIRFVVPKDSKSLMPQEYIGYQCPSCQTIVLGPPKMEKEYESHKRGHSRERLTYKCHGCDNVLLTQTGLEKCVD